MTSSSDRRSYSRIASEVSVRWAGETVDKSVRDYLEKVASNLSLGGLFIEADNPPSVGTLVKLELRLPADDADAGSEPVLVTALVRWRQRWSQPKGMGLEFLDFEGLGERDFKEWLGTVLEHREASSS